MIFQPHAEQDSLDQADPDPLAATLTVQSVHGIVYRVPVAPAASRLRQHDLHARSSLFGATATNAKPQLRDSATRETAQRRSSVN